MSIISKSSLCFLIQYDISHNGKGRRHYVFNVALKQIVLSEAFQVELVC